MQRISKDQIAEIDSQVERLMQSIPATRPLHGGPKHRKSHKKHTRPVEVSINSLLDVLSVILVFLMKSYSTTTVQVKPSKDLQVPFTHSSQQVEESTAITLTAKHIMINDMPVVNLDGGKVAEPDLSQGGLLIQPLFDKLKEEVELQKKIAQFNKKQEFKGIVSFIVDRHIPFPLLTQAMYTAGQAEYGQFKFVLIKTERS